MKLTEGFEPVETDSDWVARRPFAIADSLRMSCWLCSIYGKMIDSSITYNVGNGRHIDWIAVTYPFQTLLTPSYIPFSCFCILSLRGQGCCLSLAKCRAVWPSLLNADQAICKKRSTLTKGREGERQDDKCSVDLQEIGGKSRTCWLEVYLVTDRFQTPKHRDTCLLGSMKSRRR